MEIIEVDIAHVIEYYAEGFEAAGGKQISLDNYPLDTTKGKVLFVLSVEEKQ